MLFTPETSLGKRNLTKNPAVSYMYAFYVAGFLFFLVFFFCAIMDIRRGFLFNDYILKTTWINYTLHHMWMLAVGVSGLLFCYWLIKGAEKRGEIKEGQSGVLAKITAFAIFGILAATVVFIYRGVAMVRVLDAGNMSIPALGLNPAQLPGSKELIPLETTLLPLRPLAVTVNYLSLVWGATTLAILLAGLAATVIPLYFNRFFASNGSGKLRQLMSGLIYGIPQPFCSCCAAPISASIYTSGGSIAASVAFLLASPTLNVTALILAASLLPAPYAILRIAGGGIFVISAAYIAAYIAERRPHVHKDDFQPTGRALSFFYRAFNRYCNLFQPDASVSSNPTPSGIIRGWVINSYKTAKLVVPTFLIGGILAGIIVVFLPAVFKNNVAGVLLASLLGTPLMIATWTEIPVVTVMASQGLSGPAAALLVTLPAVSLPCLLIFGGALRSARIAILLGLTTFLFGITAGLLFL